MKPDEKGGVIWNAARKRQFYLTPRGFWVNCIFLYGHQDIEVPAVVLAKWHREAERDPQLRDIFTRMLDYRRHVLAIFDTLVGSDTQPQRVQ